MKLFQLILDIFYANNFEYKLFYCYYKYLVKNIIIINFFWNLYSFNQINFQNLPIGRPRVQLSNIDYKNARIQPDPSCVYLTLFFVRLRGNFSI